MSAPLSQNAATPWTPYTFGRLRELVLNSVFGSSDPSHASPDTTLQQANAAEIALAGGWVHEALTQLQEVHGDYFPITEDTCVAEESAVTAGTYPSVLLPADFGVAVQDGFSIGGEPVGVMTDHEWRRNIRPTSEGGGTYLTELSGTPARTRALLRIVQSRQASATAAIRWAAFLYPVQTAAWTLSVAYRAVAKALTGDTHVVRVPNRLLPIIHLYCAMRGRQQNGDLDGAMKARAIYRDALADVESIAPSIDQQAVMLLVPPLDA